MNFKDFLAEKALNDKVFKAAIERMSSTAKMGFELEMWVPEESDLLIISPEDSSIGDFNDTAKEAKQSLEDLLGYSVYVNGKTITQWRIVPDSSIQEAGIGCGIEIVSPPDPVEDSLSDLRQLFKWMTKHEVVTNSTTGIHLNLSIPDLKEKLDPLKLILFMGEEHILRKYARETNAYAMKHLDDLVNHIEKLGVPPTNASVMLAKSYMILRTDKYRTVNLSKLEHGYLEFRTAGNENYHKKFNQLEADVGRFLAVLEIACDPDAERKEYLKKISKLFSKSSEKRTSSANKQLDDVLDTMTRQVRMSDAGEDSLDQVSHAIRYAVKNVVDKGGELPLKFRSEFLTLLGKIKKNEPSLIDNLRDRVSSTDLKAFNIK